MSHLSERLFASLGRFVKPQSQYGRYNSKQVIIKMRMLDIRILLNKTLKISLIY